jgi:hypothetical protein
MNKYVIFYYYYYYVRTIYLRFLSSFRMLLIVPARMHCSPISGNPIFLRRLFEREITSEVSSGSGNEPSEDLDKELFR